MESKMYNYAKCSIPILNNSSPNNYAIMSALLSHIDSPLVSSNSLLCSSINSYTSLLSSPSITNQTIQSTYAKANKLKTNNCLKLPKSIGQFSSSKEIIYSSKKIKLQNQENKETNSTEIIFLNSKSGSNMNQDEINQQNLASKKFENSQMNDLVVIETQKDFNFNTSSTINTGQSIQNRQNFQIEENFINNLNHSELSEPSFSNYERNVYAEQNEFINNEQNFPEDTNSFSNQNINSNLVTYTISCPFDLQFNFDQIFNCFILLEKDKFAQNDTLTLKCSVCFKKFDSLQKLKEHKEQRENCKNEIKINTELKCDDEKCFESEENNESNELDDEESLDEEEELDEDELNNFDLYDCEEDLNEDLDDFELTENDDSNEIEIEKHRNKDYFYNDNDNNNNNKLVTRVRLKTNAEMELKNTESSSDFDREDIQANKIVDQVNQKPTKTRRKYTKNKGNNATNLNCEKCNKTCRTKAELLVHLHKHDGKGPECWECGKKCASFSNLVSHVQLHTGEKPYTCQFCGKQFTQDAHLTRHIRLHTGERPFVCNICGKTYKDYSYYKTHLRIHRGERLYKCNYCGKEYYDASYYKKHTRLHTGEKPYMCTVCGRQFHRSDYLKLHSYSHTDERPFNCHICGKGFKMNYNLKVHLKNHENQDLLNQTSVINSSNDETSSFNEPEHYTTSTNLNENFNNNICTNTINLSLSNQIMTNEIVSLFSSNQIGLDANTIQIINNSSNQSNSINEIEVTLLDEHQIRIVN